MGGPKRERLASDLHSDQRIRMFVVEHINRWEKNLKFNKL